ncbi:SPFH domain-containing protein [Rubripirellula amarantea]|uniref:SPFH domain / Band 7 family protein n=1 Tax=Rubripirellula amarantea TaxID=2527999 RepID=A0A5C5WSD8_9BACT|nr:SPFH domain-containing protein [Rubripirellula amarantea]MDA8744581.1 SPFH domain-containing protein [Rubripirellula amarantea]TWT53055.1 SPFH domain / Band 7 family protein [Rubripirellula amarantea]
MSIKQNKSLIGFVFSSVWLILLAIGLFEWFVCRVYVPDGHSLQLRYKGGIVFGGEDPEPGSMARDGQVGVQEEMRGPGRHFFNPLYWERTIVPDFVVMPGQIAVVTSKIGTPLPPGKFLVDGDLDGTDRVKHKGILRKVFGPGRYRANPYAFEFNIVGSEKVKVGRQEKVGGWVEIPTGHVGVVTMQTDNPQLGLLPGIQDKVLQPGLYPINPKEQQVDLIDVGFRKTSIQVSEQKDASGRSLYDEQGEPLAVTDTGINFPSNDGFDIQLDFSAIWGVLPADAAEIVRTFGNIAAVEEKVIEPQSESICRNNGSKMGAVELLIGESREAFQTAVSDEFKDVLAEKNITLLYGLVRHIYIPQEVRQPIQKGYVSDELRLTRDEETKTARIEADLREAESKVELEAERIRVDTDRLRAGVLAEGEKEAREIAAATEQLVAKIDRETAELDAQKTVMIGRAESGAEKMSSEASADKFRLAVQAFGSPAAFNKWEFAEQLPANLDLKLFYAGEGTLWTDLENITPTIPLKK